MPARRPRRRCVPPPSGMLPMSSEAVRERCARAVRRWSVLVPFALPVVLLVLLVPDGFAPGKDALGALVAQAIKAKDLDTKPGKSLHSYQVAGVAARRVVLAGIGAGDARGFRLDPGKARLSLFHRGFGNTPFGFNPGLIGGRLGEREFGGAAGAFLVFGLFGEDRAGGSGDLHRAAAGGDFIGQPRERFDRCTG